MKLLPYITVAGILWAGVASANIGLRVSVKFILGPMGQMPCCGNGTFDEFEDITNQVEAANAVLRDNGRGYRFQIAEVTTVDGDASDWFDVPRDQKDLLEAAAKADPATFKWRSDAINMYVNNADGSAVCSFPGEDTILYGQRSRATSLFHESGHFFNLRHTQQGQVNLNADLSPCTNDCACAIQIPGSDDLMDDTLDDHECYGNRSEIAQANYGLNFNQLNADQQELVENTFFNMMSYHSTRDRLTSDQMDRWTDAANGVRSHVATGRTWFVDESNGCVAPLGNSACIDTGILQFGGPFPVVALGVNMASAGDIVLVRGGVYNESLTLQTPCELRASRGNAILR